MVSSITTSEEKDPIESFPSKKGQEKTWQQISDQKDRQIRALTIQLDQANSQLKKEMEERERWSRYLHDAITQSLFSAGLIAEVLPRLWERDQETARKSLDDLRRITFGAIGEMRLLLAESRPNLLKETDFGELLALLGNALAGRLNVPVALVIHEKVRFSEEIQVSAYRVCRDALNWIAQRAKANCIHMDLGNGGFGTKIQIKVQGDLIGLPASGNSLSGDLIDSMKAAKGLGIDVEILDVSDNESELVIALRR